jgi:hypothetical protein
MDMELKLHEICFVSSELSINDFNFYTRIYTRQCTML